jgi:hypothetical protein
MANYCSCSAGMTLITTFFKAAFQFINRFNENLLNLEEEKTNLPPK